MDKNIAEQLNKAYEAFRQACMDRDSAVKELRQKTDSYEKQICEQQEKIDLLTSLVAKLQLQLASVSASRVNVYDQVAVPEDSETKRNGTLLNLDSHQLHEKLKLSMQREELLKEQLENESIKLKQAEEESNLKKKKYESMITIKDEEIRQLKKQLKEINEAENCTQIKKYEQETRSEKHISPGQEVSPRDRLETVFWGMKEEFHRIRTLTRAQTDQLSKFNLRREPATEIPFSKPIQCTDEQADDLCNPWVKKDISRGIPQFASVSPRETDQDEEENSVESLSQLNVKFPPTDNDAAFLQSTPDTLPIPCTMGTQTLLQDPQFNRDLESQNENFGDMNCIMFAEHGTEPVTSAVPNLTATSLSKPSLHTNILIQSPLDRVLKTPFLNNCGTTTFPKQDNSKINFPSSATNEKTVRASQQPLWKKSYPPPQDDDLLVHVSADLELDQPGICEFCQKVFPPSLTSREDFLRHLNSHFNLKS